MKKSIVISIVNGRLFSSSEKLHTTFQFLETDEKFPLSDRVEIHFIDLSRVDESKTAEEMSDMERLAAYIKYAGDRDKESYLESLIRAGGETIAMIEELFKELTEDQIAFEERERRWKGELDRNSLLNEAKKEGEERVNLLNSYLIKAGRFEDLKQAVEDAVFREKLYREFNL